MRAPAKTAKRTAKAKTTKAKRYTAARNRNFLAWKKAHPFKKTVKKATTAKRTLSLNGRHVVSQEEFVKLGRNTPYSEAEKPRLLLDRYLTAIEVPAVVDYASEVISWPMYGNDTIGDCTAACAGHQVQAWTRYTGAEADIPQDDIIQLYSAVSGYDPSTGANDNGAVIQDVLAYWRKSGVPVAGHQILAFAQLKDLSQVRQALYVFGSVYLGVNFPQSALDQFDADQPWDVSGDGTIVGGHAVPLQYAGTGTVPYEVITWAKPQGMTQAFLDTYCEEAWVVITADWLDKNGHTPAGLDLQQLGADLAALTGDPNPFPAPAPAPPVPVPPAPQPVDVQALLQEIEQDAKQIIADVEKVL